MNGGGHRHDRGGDEEHPHRLVQGVDAEDRAGVAPHVRPHRREQPRLARLLVRPDRHVVDRHEHLARLDDRLERVGELGDDLHLQRGLAVVGAEARGRVRHGGARGAPATTALPSRWRRFFSGEKCSIWCGLAVADHHVGLAGQDRRDQLRDVGAVVLVVGVGVHDHVGAQLQAGVEARLERRRQALVVGEPHDVVHAVRRAPPPRCRRSTRRRSRATRPCRTRARCAGGRRAWPGSWSASLKQGIWMMSFIGTGAGGYPACGPLAQECEGNAVTDRKHPLLAFCGLPGLRFLRRPQN